MIRPQPSALSIEAANAFVKQANVPKPFKGWPTWLDYTLDPHANLTTEREEGYARAELEALRKSLEDTRDALARQFDNVLEVLRQRDALEAKLSVALNVRSNLIAEVESLIDSVAILATGRCPANLVSEQLAEIAKARALVAAAKGGT